MFRKKQLSTFILACNMIIFISLYTVLSRLYCSIKAYFEAAGPSERLIAFTHKFYVSVLQTGDIILDVDLDTSDIIFIYY